MITAPRTPPSGFRLKLSLELKKAAAGYKLFYRFWSCFCNNLRSWPQRLVILDESMYILIPLGLTKQLWMMVLLFSPLMNQEKMKELSTQVPEGELGSSGPNDVFSQATGKEKSGSVRMNGLGVCPSDVWGEVPSSGTSYRMSMEWKTELDKTNKKLEELTNLYLLGRKNGGNTSNILVTSPNIPITSPNQQIGSSTSFSQRGRVKVGDYVNFKSVANPIDVVGKGRIASMDPSTEVGGEELGANWCEIHVQVPILWDEHLMRPYGGLKTVGDAIGTPIAWPVPKYQ